jgi:hypothetical protein
LNFTAISFILNVLFGQQQRVVCIYGELSGWQQNGNKKSDSEKDMDN